LWADRLEAAEDKGRAAAEARRQKEQERQAKDKGWSR
jgi:hypothetical protein